MAADDPVTRDPVMREALFRHLWQQYQASIDRRARRGDVDLLAEAAERHEWPGAPGMGARVAELLRAAYCKRTEGEAPADRMTRDREIVGLADIHRQDGISARAAAERIAAIYGMEAEAVRKVIARKRAGDK